MEAEQTDIATFHNESIVRQRKAAIAALKETVAGLLGKIAFQAQELKQQDQIL